MRGHVELVIVPIHPAGKVSQLAGLSALTWVGRSQHLLCQVSPDHPPAPCVAWGRQSTVGGRGEQSGRPRKGPALDSRVLLSRWGPPPS